jgi:4-hydroxy-3-polyprenylbenzoate decarboxylase
LKVNDLHDFVAWLSSRGQLVRIAKPVSHNLEITAIVDQVSKGPAAYNKALLFENVEGFDLPVLINMFGSAQRMAWALHIDEADKDHPLDELTRKLAELIDLHMPQTFKETVERGRGLLKALYAVGLKPRVVRHAPVQEVVEVESPSLDFIPILKCWPKDGGPFVTLPQVITRDPVSGVRNVGMYRLQKLDSRTLLVHWQRHKGGAEHARVAIERDGDRTQQRLDPLPAAIVLGGDPACIWSASAPLPPDIDEYMLAGWLRGRPVPFVNCITQPLQVPADADIVIEGYVDLTDYRPEGPFGDHTGYYTPVAPFPAFHVTAITRRQSPIYPATVVGIPPMEDYWMGKATERLFLPLIQRFIPEVVDVCMPPPGVFHNLVLVSIRKRYPGQACKVIHGLWGLALMSLAKAIVVVDDWVDVQNFGETAWQVLGNVDWSHDVLIADGPVDQLDHASRHSSYGGKIGIDATSKLLDEGYTRDWPEVVRIPPDVKAKVACLLKGLDEDPD